MGFLECLAHSLATCSCLDPVGLPSATKCIAGAGAWPRTNLGPPRVVEVEVVQNGRQRAVAGRAVATRAWLLSPGKLRSDPFLCKTSFLVQSLKICGKAASLASGDGV